MAGNLVKRILSALVLIPLVLGAVYMGGIVLYVLLALVATLAFLEWHRMVRQKERWMILEALGIVYIVIPILCFAWLTAMHVTFPFYVLFVVWLTDTGAFVFGKLIGGPKLAPRISPKKTWSGFFGGLTVPVLIQITALLLIGTPFASIPPNALYTLLLSLSAQGGDLLESWIKRQFGVKDSGAIIPGHGGILDRIDSLLVATPIAALLVLIFRHST